MKYNDWILLQESAYIDMFNENENMFSLDENEDILAVVESAEFLNEAPSVDTGNFNVIAWIRLKNNANKLMKAEAAVRMAEVEASIFKRSEKWSKMGEDEKKTFNERATARKKAMDDKLSTIKNVMDDIAGTSAKLKKMSAFLKNKAKLKALESVMKKAEKGMAESTIKDWQTTLANAKQKDTDFSTEVEKEVKELEAKAKEEAIQKEAKAKEEAGKTKNNQ